MNKKTLEVTIFFVFCFFVYGAFASEKSTLSVSSICGDISEGEFVVAQELHTYQINLKPGDIVDINIIPVGAYLQMDAELYDPTGQILEDIPLSSAGAKLILKSKKLSGRGEYKIKVRNYSNHKRSRGHKGRAGMYEIHFGCIKRNGDKIIPSGNK